MIYSSMPTKGVAELVPRLWDVKFTLLIGDWYKVDHKALRQILESGRSKIGTRSTYPRTIGSNACQFDLYVIQRCEREDFDIAYFQEPLIALNDLEKISGRIVRRARRRRRCSRMRRVQKEQTSLMCWWLMIQCLLLLHEHSISSRVVIFLFFLFIFFCHMRTFIKKYAIGDVDLFKRKKEKKKLLSFSLSRLPHLVLLLNRRR